MTDQPEVPTVTTSGTSGYAGHIPYTPPPPLTPAERIAHAQRSYLRDFTDIYAPSLVHEAKLPDPDPDAVNLLVFAAYETKAGLSELTLTDFWNSMLALAQRIAANGGQPLG